MDSYWRPPFHANTYGTLTSAEPVRGADGLLVCTMLSIRRADGVVTKVPFLAQDGQEGLEGLVGRDVRVTSIPLGQSSGGVKVMQQVVCEPPYDPLYDNWQAIQAGSLGQRIVRVCAEGVMVPVQYH
ncbi:hypothetical protein HYV82_05940 [Candidatus Woesearchaeota archaeon]|nr:hypothetical protein [Candidatus Woesearchaeota archaeon]